MASRRLVSASARETLFGIPSDTASLERNYVLADDDLDLICTRRSAENRLGLAIHIALLRHPGQGWLDGDDLPGPLIRWLATAPGTRSSHRQLAIRHLGLRPFVPDDMGTAIDLAALAAFHTDEGRIILIGLINDMKALRFVLPSTAALERIGLAGRARARRILAQALNDALGRRASYALIVFVMDTRTPKQRRRIMQAVKSKDTKLEMVVRRCLHATGYRYRLHCKGPLRKPDIAFVGRKTSVGRFSDR